MKKILLALSLALGISGAANAGLVGDTVSADLLHNGSSYGAGFTSVVGAGPEGAIFGNQQINFSDFGVTVTSLGTFCGMSCAGETIELKLTSLDLGGITGVSFSSTLNGVSMAFTSDSVTFSWLDQALSPNQPYLTARFQTGGTVPEPGSLLLMGIAGLGLAMARKRKTA